MDRLDKAASAVIRVLALIGALAVVVMMLHVCLDVAVRNLFRISFSVTNAMVASYYMVPLAFLPLGWIEYRNDMVSVELIDGFLPKALLRASDAVVAAVAAAIYALLAYATYGSMISNWTRGTMLELGQTPFHTYPSYALPFVGFALAALACLVKALDAALRPERPA